jgi:hypothetical protein
MDNSAVAPTLSYEERYLLGYMEGYRIGRITYLRKVLINCFHIKAKEQGIVPEKKLIQKINRETDLEFLLHILFDLSNNKLSVKELEMYYDMYFFVPDEEKRGDEFI